MYLLRLNWRGIVVPQGAEEIASVSGVFEPRFKALGDHKTTVDPFSIAESARDAVIIHPFPKVLYDRIVVFSHGGRLPDRFVDPLSFEAMK